jgi:ribosome biogenesis GTPase A
MNRALREISEKVALVDLVVELRDARAVLSSANSDLIAALKNKKRLIVLTKSDLALDGETEKWVSHFKTESQGALSINLLKLQDITLLIKTIAANDHEKRLKEAARGMKPQPLRIMVVGVPNVGKSTLINKLANKRATQVENRPGKTKAQQWIKVRKQFELLDTPGILPMKFEDKNAASNLAMLGMIKEENVPQEEVAIKIVGYLRKYHSSEFFSFYNLEITEDSDDRETINQIAQRSGLLSGGKPNLERAYMMVLDDFRDGKIARVTLETI